MDIDHNPDRFTSRTSTTPEKFIVRYRRRPPTISSCIFCIVTEVCCSLNWNEEVSAEIEQETAKDSLSQCSAV